MSQPEDTGSPRFTGSRNYYEAVLRGDVTFGPGFENTPQGIRFLSPEEIKTHEIAEARRVLGIEGESTSKERL